MLTTAGLIFSTKPATSGVPGKSGGVANGAGVVESNRRRDRRVAACRLRRGRARSSGRLREGAGSLLLAAHGQQHREQDKGKGPEDS